MYNGWGFNNFAGFHAGPIFWLFAIPIFAALLALKGMALWLAAKGGKKNWFVALLVINTFGILELLYIFYFSKKRGSNH